MNYIKKALMRLIREYGGRIPDRQYLQLLYRIKMGKKLNLDHPQTMNEKLQWLKLYNRNPRYIVMVDKVKVKDYVASVIGEQYVIPTFGVWDTAEDLDFNLLPDKFVIKCNHNSGRGIYICKDKGAMDVKKVRHELRQGLKENYYLSYREWPYKHVPRRIIAEQFLEDGTGEDIKDYKFFCFGGHVEFCKVDFDRFIDHHANYYDRDWNLLPFGEANFPPIPGRKIERPKGLDTMISLAERLATDIPFVRIDFYDVNDKIYFGEITFFPAAGMDHWTPEEQDTILGKFISLPID